MAAKHLRPLPGRRRSNVDPGGRDAGLDVRLRHRVRHMDAEAGHAAADQRARVGRCSRPAVGVRRVYSDSVQPVPGDEQRRELRPRHEHVDGRAEPQSRAVLPRRRSGR